MKKNLKKISWILICAILLNWFIIQPINVTAADNTLLYETTTKQTILTGLTYEKKTKLTKDGWVDIYVLIADMNQPYLDFGVTRSFENFGKKENLLNLMKSTDMVAGVNASFFGMNGAYSNNFGNEIYNGNITTGSNGYNINKPEAASVIEDIDGNVMLSYFGMTMDILTDQGNMLYIGGINRVDQWNTPQILYPYAFKDTKFADSQYGKLYKIVVENNIVTYISQPGELVQIPENGYVITIPDTTWPYHVAKFQLGTVLTLDIKSTLDVTRQSQLVSGGGFILRNGAIANDGLSVEPTKRHPRTALGLDQDGSHMVLMVVDGRGISIGANHNELAGYLKEYGCVNAMYFDGGGSTTMTLKAPLQDELKIVNTVSDGAPRKIINGIGFYSEAPQGVLTSLKITASTDRIAINTPVTYTVHGFDEYGRQIALDESSILWKSEGASGQWSSNVFTPKEAGKATITCTYLDKTGIATLSVVDQFNELRILPETINLDKGESVTLQLKGTDSNGYTVDIDSSAATWSMSPNNLGSIDQAQVFTAGYTDGVIDLTATINGRVAHSYISIGSQEAEYKDFENKKIAFVGYPNTVLGTTKLQNQVTYEGSQSIQLSYEFPVSSVTQAAYIQFEDLNIPTRANSIGLWVYGENQNHLLRAKVTDANGNSNNITFSSSIDWNGWKHVVADLPSNAVYPLSIDRIYVASLTQGQAYSGEIYIDKLVVNYPPTTDIKREATISGDPLRLDQAPESAPILTVFGNLNNANSLLQDLVYKQIEQLLQKSTTSMVVGKGNFNTAGWSKQPIVWANTFATYEDPNYRIISLATDKGNFRLNDYYQWTKLQQQLADATQSNIILVGNNSPIISGAFTDQREADLLHETLKNYQKKSNKTIYYINASGYETSSRVYEGIHYINLNGLAFKANAGKLDLTNTFKVLNFYLVNDQLHYKIDEVYKKIVIK